MSKSASKTHIMVEGALMIALSVVLNNIKIFEMPQGGSITLQMVPLVLMGLRNGPRWGAFTGFVCGFLEMILGFQNVLYCQTLLSQIGCILLDYLLASIMLGLASVFAKPFSNKLVGIGFGCVIVGMFSFLCNFVSGFLLWGSYAPDGQSAIVYSFVYNITYCLPNTIIMTIICVVLYRYAPKLFETK